jgi:MYXO-CTERM domain-containing protein
MAYRWIALLVCALAALFPTRASACSCFIGGPADFAKSADAIFHGRLVSVEQPSRFGIGEASHMVTARFQVLTVWKGPTKAELEVKTAFDGTACGIPFTPGEYLVFARQAKDGTFRVSTCDGTEEFSYSKEQQEYLKEHFTAVDMTKVPATAAAASSCASTPGSGLLPAMVLLAFWLRRR